MASRKSYYTIQVHSLTSSKSKIISFIVQKNGAYFITSDDVGPFNDVGYCSVPRDYPRQIQKRVNTIISEPDSAKREELVKETINYSHRVTGCGSPFNKEMYDKSQASVAAGTAQSIFNKGSLTVIDTEDDDDESMDDK